VDQQLPTPPPGLLERPRTCEAAVRAMCGCDGALTLNRCVAGAALGRIVHLEPQALRNTASVHATLCCPDPRSARADGS
jgi:hypothetical protein